MVRVNDLIFFFVPSSFFFYFYPSSATWLSQGGLNRPARLSDRRRARHAGMRRGRGMGPGAVLGQNL